MLTWTPNPISCPLYPFFLGARVLEFPGCPMVRTLRFIAGVQVPSPDRELRPCMPCALARKSLGYSSVPMCKNLRKKKLGLKKKERLIFFSRAPMGFICLYYGYNQEHLFGLSLKRDSHKEGFHHALTQALDLTQGPLGSKEQQDILKICHPLGPLWL